MDSLLVFAKEHRVFFAAILILDCMLVFLTATRLYLLLNKHLAEGLGGRSRRKSPYYRCLESVREHIEEFENRAAKEGFFIRLFRKSKSKVKQCGMYSNIAVFSYMALKYLLPAASFVLAFILNFPNAIPAAFGALIIHALVEYTMRCIRRNLENEFKYSAYKIYRYLHNQISSGVCVTDAIKTAYKVVENSSLRDNLILMSARYARTLDIESSLEDFKSRYSLQEVDSLCIALKQGIATGDNKDILERQEKLMFNQYFNYVQAETEACKRKRTLVVAIYALIIIILIAIPLINDANDAVSKIFLG